MAERDDLQKRYAYHEMSNKVEQASGVRRTRGEPTGEVETLRGRTDIGRMGDRIIAVPVVVPKPPPRKKAKHERSKKSAATAGIMDISSSAETTILDVGNLTGYQPSTDASRAAYESMLTVLSGILGTTQGPQFLRDAAEEVISCLKDESLRDPQRHAQLSKTLTGKASGTPGGLGADKFSSLVQLGKQLDDYGRQATSSANKTTDEVDDEMGVAVLFEGSDDEENQNDDSDVDENVVVDASSSSSDEDEESEDEGDKKDNDNNEERLVQGGDEKKKSKHDENRVFSVHEIDAHFLQRQLSKKEPYKSDPNEAASKAAQVLEILDVRNGIDDKRELENKLVVLLGIDLFSMIGVWLQNRVRIWGCIAMKRAANDEERAQIEQVLKESDAGKRVWDELHGKAEEWSRLDKNKGVKSEGDAGGADAADKVESMDIDKTKATELDLDLLAFRDGGHLSSNKTCTLPSNSFRAMKKGYEEVHVPAVRSVIPPDEKLIPIKDLPEWTQSAFKGMTDLNRIQSKMCNVALKTSENLLLCAPTGAGKTNVACLTMLNILGQYRKKQPQPDDDDAKKPEFDLGAFKIVYVAPMKALVQEVVKNFSSRLKDFGVTVRELTGDSSLTRQQIGETQLLVTTPEKLNVVTRQGEGRAYTQLVRLVILDEIHLLHDERGPVLEALVARFIRQVETTAEPIRLVGLSATLPNYADVAAFLRVNPETGLFFFDNSYRPVPLQMQYIGITERNAFKRFQLQNEICFEKCLDMRRNHHQILIFVHSRAETAKTAKALRDLASEKDQLTHFCRDGGATQEILRQEAQGGTKNASLKDVLPFGFAIHHAGMTRNDRELVEDLFADGHVAVLCCTATLAWGVNLPAHAVILRGTQIYNPSLGKWTELSPLDVLQMLGRAGRPQYDSEGEGIILTQHSELQYYLSLTNLQLPVESQLIKTLPDHLNAEIVLGTIQTIQDAVDWLSYTFLYIRMLQNPTLYGIAPETLKQDPTLERRRLDLAHSAATILEKNHLVRYDRNCNSGSAAAPPQLYATPLGRVASSFYIGHASMAVYTRHMRPTLSDIELLRLFALSGEFTQITVREEEKLELTKLAGRVPIPVKEAPSEPSAKINILLQAYISRLRLDGFALAADMAFIQQSAGRILRALFEIALRRNWAHLAKLCLSFSNMVQHRIWQSQSPLRQFGNVPEIVARKLERKSDIDWNRYTDLTASDLGELVGVPQMGRVLHKLVHQFPRLSVSAQIQPITRSLLRVELTLVAGFTFDVLVHGYVQLFHVWVEDVNGEVILHHELFSLRSNAREEEHVLVFSVPILEPLPPAYFIRVISDRWLHSESVLPVSFSTLILPSKFPPPTELLDLQPLLPSALGEDALVQLYKQEFNPIQTQTFHELFKTNRNCLVCAPSGSGKTVCAEFAILRMLTTNAQGKCVYVAPTDDICQVTFERWSQLFGGLFNNNKKHAVVRLTGETAPDLLKLLQASKICICSVTQWDILSRRWRQRKAVQAVTLYVFDELQFLGGERGPPYELIISRTRYIISSSQQNNIRVVGLSASLANARDVGDWMGVSSLFNFSPRARPNPLEIFISAFEQTSHAARLYAMAKPVYNAILRHLTRQALVYVPSRRQAQLTAIDIMTYHQGEEESLLGSSIPDGSTMKELTAPLREPALQQTVAAGIGFVHSGMMEAEWNALLDLYSKGIVRVLVCPVDLCWKLPCRAQLVLIMGTELYDGREGRHVDYAVTDLLHMMGRHESNNDNNKCVLLVEATKKDYLKKLLYDSLPIESHLDSYLHDPLNAEIVTKTVTSMQDAIDYITWTLLYRRLSKNPTYYGLRGTSNQLLSEHLSEMMETVIGDLEESKCCKLNDDGDLSPLNLGLIAAFYYVQYRTIELIASSITAKTKIRGVLEILAASWEFSNLPIRYGEVRQLKIWARTLVHALPADASFTDSNTKALVLLQLHLMRKPVTADLRTDQGTILKDSIRLIQSIVDVISSQGWLKPALAAMELSQMIVQGLWNKDHVLKQIPHFTDAIVKRCTDYKSDDGQETVETVFDILTLDDDVRNSLLQLPDDKMADVAVFCNNYPSVEVSFEVKDPDDATAGEPVRVVVTLEREVDDDDDVEDDEDLGTVSAPLFPAEKKEAWWVVLGYNTNSLLSLKRVTLKRQQKVTLDFMAPDEAGDYDLTLFCMSDSYMGCDQEYKVPLSVAAAAADNDDSDNSDSSSSSSSKEEE